MNKYRLSPLCLLLIPAVSAAEMRNLTEQESCYLNGIKGASGEVTVQTLLDACKQETTLVPEESISKEIEQQTRPEQPPSTATKSTSAPAASTMPTTIAPPIPALPDEPAPRRIEAVPSSYSADAAPTTPDPDSKTIPASLLEELNRSVGVSAKGFSGEIYNPSADWVITEITFRIWPKDSDAATAAREYPLSLSVPPKKSAPFFLQLAQSVEQLNWEIVRARGKPFTQNKSAGEELMDAILHKEE